MAVDPEIRYQIRSMDPFSSIGRIAHMLLDSLEIAEQDRAKLIHLRKAVIEWRCSSEVFMPPAGVDTGASNLKDVIVRSPRETLQDVIRALDKTLPGGA